MADSVTLAQIVGAVLFSCGSACFVWMAWADDWLLPLRLGCALWIAGCLPYLWPPLWNEYHSTGGHVSNALQVGGMLSWAVGSALAFHDDLGIGLPVTNGGFLAGSVCLLLDALLQARQLSDTEIMRDERISLLADLLASLLYVLAGGFGGYAMELGLLRFGNCCWLVGSLIGGVRPCLALAAGGRTGRGTSVRPARTCVELEEARSATVMHSQDKGKTAEGSAVTVQ